MPLLAQETRIIRPKRNSIRRKQRVVVKTCVRDMYLPKLLQIFMRDLAAYNKTECTVIYMILKESNRQKVHDTYLLLVI